MTEGEDVQRATHAWDYEEHASRYHPFDNPITPSHASRDVRAQARTGWSYLPHVIALIVSICGAYMLATKTIPQVQHDLNEWRNE